MLELRLPHDSRYDYGEAEMKNHTLPKLKRGDRVRTDDGTIWYPKGALLTVEKQTGQLVVTKECPASIHRTRVTRVDK